MSTEAASKSQSKARWQVQMRRAIFSASGRSCRTPAAATGVSVARAGGGGRTGDAERANKQFNQTAYMLAAQARRVSCRLTATRWLDTARHRALSPGRAAPSDGAFDKSAR